MVSSLDDRAQLAHGLNFGQLSAAEQNEILRRYRVGRFILSQTQDERQEALQLKANEMALRFLRVSLVGFIGAYWAIYLWLPVGDWRDMLTDSSVIISWLALFVVSLPQMIVMWTEPDEIREPRVINSPVPQHESSV